MRVLDAAMGVFSSYGYPRVTMDDIAKAADMSRPALYLMFKNKADIYRAIGERMFHLCQEAIAAALAGPGSLGDRLTAAIEEAIIEMMCQVTDSPHGAELLDLKNKLAADLIERWHTAMADKFSRAIAAEASRTSIDLEARGLSADGLALMLLDGLEGMKQRVPDAASQRIAARQLVRVIELSLRA